jgi:hypothetical protein
MKLSSLRRNAQIALAVIAVLAASGAALRYFTRGGTFFGEHVVVTPSAGPVGLRPFFEFPGYDEGREVTVYLCASTTGGIEDCASLGKGKAGQRLTGSPIPHELPDTTAVEPGTYILRAGPGNEGSYPERGRLEVIAFTVGDKPRAPGFDGVAASALRVGLPRHVARGAPCRPPLFLADGRLAIGSNVVDPESGVTIEFDIEAYELAWSPVGDKLAILTTDRKEIRLAGPDGASAVTKVREARGLLSSLSWSPEGDRLAYIAQPDPATRQLTGDPTSPTVKILNATNGTQTAAGPGLSVAWSPTGDVLAVEMAGGVIQSSTTAGTRKALATGRRPAWSHDARFLAVVRTEGDQTKGYIVPAAGGPGIAVTGNGGCAMSFSPTGEYVSVVASTGGQSQVQLRTLTVAGREAS